MRATALEEGIVVTGRSDGSCVLGKCTFLGDTDARDETYAMQATMGNRGKDLA